MKKILLALIASLWATLAVAQGGPGPIPPTVLLGMPNVWTAQQTFNLLPVFPSCTGYIYANSSTAASCVYTQPTLSALNNSALKAITSQIAGEAVYRFGYDASGDGGDATYVYSSSNCSLNAGAGDNGSQVAPTSGGGCWNIIPQAAGYSAAIWGAKGDLVTDDGPALSAAMSALSSLGGGKLLIGTYSYLDNSTDITIAKNVELSCSGSILKLVPNLDYTSVPCALYLNPTYSIYMKGGTLQGVGVLTTAVHTTPMIGATRAQMEAFIAGFSGTGISVGDSTLNDGTGSSSHIENVLVGGFAQCISQDYQTQQVVYRDILGDCTSGIKIDNSHDDNHLDNVELWEFLTTNQTHTFDNWSISGIANNGSGAWRVTTSAANNLITGEKIWVSPAGTAEGAGGQWTITVIDSTHFDLQGSSTSASPTGNTTSGSTYIPVSSVANLSPYQHVSGTGIPSGATIAAVWRSRNAISLDQAHPATATNAGVTLSVTNDSYTSGGYAFYDGTWRTGTGFDFRTADGTVCAQCFSFGFATGFSFNGSIGMSLTNTQQDQVAGVSGHNEPHLPNQNLVPIGIQFVGTQTYGNYLQMSLNTSGSIGVMNNMTGFPGGAVSNVLSLARYGSSSPFSTLWENAAGGFTLRDVTASAGSTILLDASANVPFIIGNYIPGTALYGTTNTPPAFNTSQQAMAGSVENTVPFNLVSGVSEVASSGAAYGVYYSASQAADEKYWRWADNGSLCLHSLNDAYSTAVNAICFQRNGIYITGVSVGGPLQIQNVLAVNLPICNSGAKGQNVYVTDLAASPSYGATITSSSGGGSIGWSVNCNGSNWTAH